MRSLGFTFLLAVLAVSLCGIASYQWRQGGFEAVFGRPATPVGETLYQAFDPAEVTRIQVNSPDTEGVFVRENGGWQCLTPWRDRMDPVAADAIIRFTLGMRVEDHSPEEKVSLDSSGLGSKAVELKLIDSAGQTLAHYRIGRISTWKALVEGAEQPVNTLFVKPLDSASERHVYLCTGDITPLFQDGLKLLRDHRPLYFNPLNLQKISIQSPQGEITLGHEQPLQAWRILKPLELPTQPKAMDTLMKGLLNLRAVQVINRSQVTLPEVNATTTTTRISLHRFGEGPTTTLDIYPAESLDSTHLMAVVNDRPDTVFELPIRPSAGLITLADLPLDVNALRDPTLTNLNIAALKSILISPSTGVPILISREPPQPWMATINGREMPANEQNIYRLLKAVTESRAEGFESDAASDFSPWGLDRPILSLRFLGVDNTAFELRFGMNSRGEFFANRTGTPTVMRVARSVIDAITVVPHEWRHARVWSLNRAMITRLAIQHGEQEPLELSYDFLDEGWQARRGLEDLTPLLVPMRANFLLTQLEGIETARWLAPGDPAALAALASPSLSFTVSENTEDEDGNHTGIRLRTLVLAPASGPGLDGFHYGMLVNGSHPFLIDNPLYQKLSAGLLEP